jgi:hypothetical protein
MSIIELFKLNLPKDILNEIKTYLYHDMRTFQFVLYKSSKKENLNKQIKNALSKNNITFPENILYNENSPYWWFRVLEQKKPFQLFAQNCMKCGYYQSTSTDIQIKSLCFC